MVENSPNGSSSIDTASKEELIDLLTNLGDPSVFQQIDFPAIPGVEDLRNVPAENLEVARLKCNVARILQTDDPVYTHQYQQENPDYFKNLIKTEKFLKGWGF